jgi:hypothetical protein
MKILILSFFLFPSSFFLSQGNLQFNQVITGTGMLGPNSSSGIYTVPAGKVLKIEAVNQNNSAYFQIGINGYEVPLTSFKFPFWLKTGDTFYVRYSLTTAGIGINFQFSAIEFNIIP